MINDRTRRTQLKSLAEREEPVVSDQITKCIDF